LDDLAREEDPIQCPLDGDAASYLLLGLNAIGADSPALPRIVIEIPTPPTPIPEQGSHHLLCGLHIINLRSNSLEFFVAASSWILFGTTSPCLRAREAEVYRIAMQENAIDPFLRARPPES
jgi:hypothetical protein